MRLKLSCMLAAVGILLISTTAQAANPDDVAKLLKTKECNRCDLSGADLIGADLVGAELQDANLNAANLTGADLSKADLTRASLAGGNLVGANLQRATLSETSLVYANLALAQLNNALLNKTDLQAANLTGANLLGAKITESSLIGANLYGVKADISLRATASGNVFQGQIGVGLARTTVEQQKPSLEPPDGSESGATRGGTRTLRRYKIPLWIGKPLRSTAGAVRFHNPENPNLEINIW